MVRKFLLAFMILYALEQVVVNVTTYRLRQSGAGIEARLEEVDLKWVGAGLLYRESCKKYKVLLIYTYQTCFQPTSGGATPQTISFNYIIVPPRANLALSRIWLWNSDRFYNSFSYFRHVGTVRNDGTWKIEALPSIFNRGLPRNRFGTLVTIKEGTFDVIK